MNDSLNMAAGVRPPGSSGKKPRGENGIKRKCDKSGILTVSLCKKLK